MKAEFHPDAAEEIIETTAYYDTEVPGLGNGFLAEVERIIGLLKEQPQMEQG